MDEFVPLFRNPHVQTITGHFWPRALDTRRHPVRRRIYRTAPGVQVAVDEQQPETRRGDVILVHGLEGSGEAGYMRGMAQTALRAGFAAHRFHMRTCGGTEAFSNTLYHSGLTADLLAVIRELGRPVFLVGFSLGGNVVLKLAGELGAEAPGLVRGVCAVSTPIDLAACARRLGERQNRMYELRFLRRMRARLIATGRYRAADFAGLDSIIAFDHRITAPAFGFRDAWHYYETQSAKGFLEGIRVPALLIQARDDTLIPFQVFQHPALRANRSLRLLATSHGGHLGFLARGANRFWLDATIIEWILDGTNLIRMSS